ncbi:hypothetical protein [Synechococcus sp. CC9616]|uniref:hypothetical protein n=1 Tax=Synechococcus sp. CC9616 TaxID=110663 RepID=UPI0004B95D75|nr:hypothetical protein [Synechococcus sp. CC9616]
MQDVSTMFGMKQTLQNAYNALMAKAPGAAFPRARRLYLNKYQLPQSDEKHGLRLFVSEESLDESQHPAEDGEPHHRIVTLTSTPRELAVVHWQQPEAPEQADLQRWLDTAWGLDAEELTLTPWPEPWFRDGGHQTRFQPPRGLIWQQHSLLTLLE